MKIFPLLVTIFPTAIRLSRSFTITGGLYLLVSPLYLQLIPTYTSWQPIYSLFLSFLFCYVVLFGFRCTYRYEIALILCLSLAYFSCIISSSSYFVTSNWFHFYVIFSLYISSLSTLIRLFWAPRLFTHVFLLNVFTAKHGFVEMKGECVEVIYSKCDNGPKESEVVLKYWR